MIIKTVAKQKVIFVTFYMETYDKFENDDNFYDEQLKTFIIGLN